VECSYVLLERAVEFTFEIHECLFTMNFRDWLDAELEFGMVVFENSDGLLTKFFPNGRDFV